MANPKSSRSSGSKRAEGHVPNRTEHDLQKAPRPETGESSASNPSNDTDKLQENRNHPKEVNHPGTSTQPGWGQG
jgi:hypothetical protein